MLTETITILLVEDNSQDACLAKQLLQDVESFQFQWIHVSGLADALTYLTRKTPIASALGQWNASGFGATPLAPQAGKVRPERALPLGSIQQNRLPSISVILLDWSLPDAQGIEALMQLHRVSPDIPIVVMSDSYHEAIAIKALQKGAQDYLVKSQTNGHLLVRSVRHAIERQRIQQRRQKVQKKWFGNGTTVRNGFEKVQLAVNTTSDITQHKRVEEALARRDRLLEGVATAIRQFLITTDYHQAIARSLSILAMAADVDSAYIFENHINEKTGEPLVSQRFEWAREQVAIQDRPQLQNLSYLAHLPYWYESLATGQSVKGLVRDFPHVEREILESQNIRSILVVPVMTQDSFWGFISFAAYHSDRQWTEYEESILTVMAGSLGSAIVRASIEEALRESQTKYRTLKEAAEAGSRTKSEFLATVSHELRTPLNAVLGLSQLLQQELWDTLNDKQKEYITCIQSSGEHLLALINDILDLSKVEAGKEQLSFVPLQVGEMCEHCLSMVREQAYERGLQLNVHIDSQVRICIADERRCKQMLLNLLSNAVKFTLSGEVSLIVQKLPEGISFTVEDTGIGIPADKLPLLFEPFRQLDSGLNRKFPGTGLGLALTRSLARLHGGDVTVHSTLGKGSQFTLYLPDSLSEELLASLPQKSAKGGEQGNSHVTNGRILIVENDERSAMLLKDYLQTIGHEVKYLSNGTGFLDLVRSFKPHLILLDVQLREDCTGFDLLAALRREPDTKNLKVVMVTGMAMADNSQYGSYSCAQHERSLNASRDSSLEEGADDYLSKPIGIAQLEAILMRHL
jgi:signal transduction histidine kinase